MKSKFCLRSPLIISCLIAGLITGCGEKNHSDNDNPPRVQDKDNPPPPIDDNKKPPIPLPPLELVRGRSIQVGDVTFTQITNHPELGDDVRSRSFTDWRRGDASRRTDQ